ncbi:uncharacterized protein TNCV_2509171 [Trichonephila clavipes]|nr:uncharacterized protein TNCV_2509171 [Trichonephila clavipes]
MEFWCCVREALTSLNRPLKQFFDAPVSNYYSNSYLQSYSDCRDSRTHDHFDHYGFSTQRRLPWQNYGGGDRWYHHLSSLRGIPPSLFVLSPVWCSRPRTTTGVLLAPCYDEFCGPRSDYVRQVALATAIIPVSTTSAEKKELFKIKTGAQNSLNSVAPFMSVDDPEVTELFKRHKFYQEELQRSECECSTLSPCTSLGYTVHGTPPASPTKFLKDNPALSKINSNKRKESDDVCGFISPSRRQTIKKPNLILNSTFTLETGNTFAHLNEKNISGTPSSQTITHDNNTANNTNQIKKFLPSPVMLYCTDSMKIINTAFPHLSSKLSGEFIKLYADNSEQYR